MTGLIYLVRHGEVDNPRNIRYGRLPGYRLSARGKDQARATARHLRARGQPIVAAIVSSPLERAVETATLLLEDRADPRDLALDPRVTEAANDFDGRPRYAPMLPWQWRRLPNPFRPSWGEPFAEVARRMQAAILAHLRDDAAVAIVSHQSPIWLALHAFEGRRGPPWLSRVRCGHGSVTTLRFVAKRYVGHDYWAP